MQKTSESDSSPNKGAKKAKAEGAPVPSFPNPTWTEEEHNMFADFLNTVADKAVFEATIPEMAKIVRGYSAAIETQKKVSGYIFDLSKSTAIAPKGDK